MKLVLQLLHFMCGFKNFCFFKCFHESVDKLTESESTELFWSPLFADQCSPQDTHSTSAMQASELYIHHIYWHGFWIGWHWCGHRLLPDHTHPSYHAMCLGRALPSECQFYKSDVTHKSCSSHVSIQCISTVFTLYSITTTLLVHTQYEGYTYMEIFTRRKFFCSVLMI